MYTNQGKKKFLKITRSSMLLLDARISAGVQNNTFTNKIHIAHTITSPELTCTYKQSVLKISKFYGLQCISEQDCTLVCGLNKSESQRVTLHTFHTSTFMAYNDSWLQYMVGIYNPSTLYATACWFIYTSVTSRYELLEILMVLMCTI